MARTATSSAWVQMLLAQQSLEKTLLPVVEVIEVVEVVLRSEIERQSREED